MKITESIKAIREAIVPVCPAYPLMVSDAAVSMPFAVFTRLSATQCEWKRGYPFEGYSYEIAIHAKNYDQSVELIEQIIENCVNHGMTVNGLNEYADMDTYVQIININI